MAMRRWWPPAIVTLAAVAALTALTADAAARQARTAPPTEATAPRDAGEPIMAIVSIKSQQVTFYDADGWILRAPVSTGIAGRETPAGVFAVIEKDKDHHSTMYDVGATAPAEFGHAYKNSLQDSIVDVLADQRQRDQRLQGP